METVVGIFNSRERAEEAIKQARAANIPDKRIVVLAPGATEKQVESNVRTTETESPGMGQAMGATVGGAIGIASGFSLGAAAASLFVPGVGPVIAAGVLAASILGWGGAATGLAVGEALEDNLAVGVPHDELFIYEDALRRGRTVAIVFAEDDEAGDRVRNLFARMGAESIDAAREDWWLGLRDAEEETYGQMGRDFKADEVSYRRGFEAALNARFRGKAYEQASGELKDHLGDAQTDEAFRAGYERGLAYQKDLETTYKK